MPTGGGGGSFTGVKTDATLTGSGTGASPLHVVSNPNSWYSQGVSASNQALSAINTTDVFGFLLPWPLTFAHMAVDISVADGSGTYDIGIYNSAGALIANIGAQHLGSSGIRNLATVQGAQTIAAGLYMFAWTGTAVVAKLAVGGSLIVPSYGAGVQATSGGALNSTVPAQVVSPTYQETIFALY